MKIDIGPYKGDLIPIRRLEQAYTWRRHDTWFKSEKEYDFIDKIVYGFLDLLSDVFRPINRWSNNRERKIKVRVDNYDVWSADHTLALVIHPVLLKLKEVQQGACHIDLEDVPENLRPTDEPNDNNGYVDNTHFDRWNWVLDEMIWAFEQCSKPDRGDDQFYHNSDQLEMVSAPSKDNPELFSVDFNYQKDPAKPKYWVDDEGKKLHYDRINNGFRLFAKYYFALWD